MHPVFHENFVSIPIAVVASFIFGWIWHGPVFGKLLSRIHPFMGTAQPDSSKLMNSMIIQVVSLALTAYVMVYTTNIWRPSVWGVGMDEHWCKYSFCSGLFTWLGFYIPMLLNATAWENRSWKMFTFTAIYQFLNLQLIAAIVSYMYAH